VKGDGWHRARRGERAKKDKNPLLGLTGLAGVKVAFSNSPHKNTSFYIFP
jgi:hypothetical protein